MRNKLRLLNVLEKAWKAVRQWIFPLRCPVCDGIVVPYGEKICADCIEKLKIISSDWCLRCGKKLENEGEYCYDCRRKKHEFIRGRSLYSYDSAAMSIYRFKYGGRAEYADYFGEEIYRYLGDFIREVRPDALIPIPLHKKRMRARGYNQAALLAESVGRYSGVPVYNNLLLRIRNTAALKTLNPTQRQNNLKKAFIMSRNDVKLKTVILIDDIYTTGSTIDEACRVLKDAEIQNIYFITLAGGKGHGE
jgi:ComF family protein